MVYRTRRTATRLALYRRTRQADRDDPAFRTCDQTATSRSKLAPHGGVICEPPALPAGGFERLPYAYRPRFHPP